MASVGAVISSIRNIMRQDRGISGDAQRLEQLGWMLFLKIIHDKDQELEVIKDNYISVIPEKYQWSNWASNLPKKSKTRARFNRHKAKYEPATDHYIDRICLLSRLIPPES